MFIYLFTLIIFISNQNLFYKNKLSNLQEGKEDEEEVYNKHMMWFYKQKL